MSLTPDSVLATQPRLFETTYGSWLAVSDREGALQIGVIGDSREDAFHRFEDAREAWSALCGRPDTGSTDDSALGGSFQSARDHDLPKGQ